jgi:RNA polymerase sigma factor (sigma-70 family)
MTINDTLDKMTGQLVLESLATSNRTVVNKIYRECYPSVKHMILANSGTIYDAEDIFHDAFTLIIEKAKKKSLELSCSFKTYIYSVSFNMWQKQLMRKAREIKIADNLELPDETDHEQKIYSDKLYNIFRHNFELLTSENQKILNMYLSKYSMKKITSEMGYANEQYAKVKKYLCKENLKKHIHNDTKFKKLILSYSN